MRLVEFTKPSVNGHNRALWHNHPFNGLFEQALAKEHASFVPAVNISEEETVYKIELSAPGYDKADFKIAVEKRALTISGKHNEEKEVKEQKFSRKEFNYGSFQRAFKLPENADEQAIAAKYENGILTLEIPKKEQEKKESIEIKVD